MGIFTDYLNKKFRRTEKKVKTTNPTTKALNLSHKKGLYYELESLKIIHKFGYATSEVISEIIYPERNNKKRLAQNLLKRLNTKNLVSVRYLPQNLLAFVLNEKGVKYLKSFGIESQSGTNILSKYSDRNFHKFETTRSKYAYIRHRLAANAFILAGQNTTDYCLYYIPEYQILSLSPNSVIDISSLKGKSVYNSISRIPDGALEYESYVEFLEVEASKRNSKSIKKLLSDVLSIIDNPKNHPYIKTSKEVHFAIIFVGKNLLRQQLPHFLTYLYENGYEGYISEDYLSKIDFYLIEMKNLYVESITYLENCYNLSKNTADLMMLENNFDLLKTTKLAVTELINNIDD